MSLCAERDPPQGAAFFAPPLRAEGEKGVYDFTVMQYGKPVSLEKYRGKVRASEQLA